MQQTDKHFFTLAAYKLHALCVNKYFPVQPLPFIILPFGVEESYSAGGPLGSSYEHFHPENSFADSWMVRVFNRIDQSTLMICEYSTHGGK